MLIRSLRAAFLLILDSDLSQRALISNRVSSQGCNPSDLTCYSLLALDPLATDDTRFYYFSLIENRAPGFVAI